MSRKSIFERFQKMPARILPNQADHADPTRDAEIVRTPQRLARGAGKVYLILPSILRAGAVAGRHA